MRDRLLDLVRAHDELADLDPAERRLAVRSLIAARSDGSDDVSVAEIADSLDGYGPVAGFMRDEGVTDVLINGPGEVWVERKGVLERTDASFAGASDLRAFADRLLGSMGERVDAGMPIAAAVLPDGSRFHVVIPPLAPQGPIVSIRRFPQIPFSLDDLVTAGMLTAEAGSRLGDAVRARLTIGITGSTGSGKTTLMNALLGLVPQRERVVLVEETPELHPGCKHVVSLTSRVANVEGKGGIGLDQLLRAALRMRPDRIVVGEVRGAEALVALGAMATGHEGSLVTFHARSSSDASTRFMELALQAPSAPSQDAVRAQVERAFDLFVHVARDAGHRRVVAITERDER